MRRIAVLLLAGLAAACGEKPLEAVPFPPSEAPPPLPEAPPPSDAELLADLVAWDAATPEQRLAVAERLDAVESAFSLSRLERFTCGEQSHEVAIFDHARTGLEFVLIPGGRAQVGSPPGSRDRDGAHPRQWVTFTRPFLIARTETTWEAWRRARGEDPDPEGAADISDRPVAGMTFAAIEEFCRLAGLELPSEARWEYACRAGAVGRWCFGDDRRQLPRYAWCGSETGGDEPSAVARLLPNAFGLFDVHGNVEEICADRYGPPSPGLTEEPATEGAPALRPARGGHVNDVPVTCGARRSFAKHPSKSLPVFTGLRPSHTLAPPH